jgi:hypothetical protein
VVVSVTGSAREAGNVLTTWKSGCTLPDGLARINLMTGLSAIDVKAGKRVSLMAPATPARFDRDKTASPTLGLVEAKNITIEGVEVQVWSGMAGTSWLQWFTASPVVGFGVVMRVVTLVFRRL